MNISQDGFFLAPPPPPATTNNGFLQAHQEQYYPNYQNPNPNPNTSSAGTSYNKKKRNSSRTPDSETEVVALSPKSLMATHRFICEVCNKGFQRDQNLQLHRRGHNLPWKLKQRTSKDQVKKKVYICPEMSCVNHDPSRALGDLTGIKKHYSRKHGEKKWKCDKCSKKYAVMSDWKAHIKICGSRQYKCTCGTIFSRKDSFISHKAVCDTLTDERMRISTTITATSHTHLLNIMRSDLMHGSLMSAPPSVAPGIFSLPASQRQDLLGNVFEPSSNSMSTVAGLGLINKPRPPLWLDHHHISSGPEAFLVPSSSVTGAAPSFPEPPAPDPSLFATSRPLVPLLKDEEEINKPIFHPESLISLYSSPPSSSSSSLISNMNLHQRHLLRQHMNNQLAGDQQGFATRNELSVMCNALSGDEFDDGSRERQGNIVGMRDFLGSLGGGEGGNNGVENGERRLFVQEGIAYDELSTMTGSSHQEPYMDLMR